jgi:enoyl-CoA hydratase
MTVFARYVRITHVFSTDGVRVTLQPPIGRLTLDRPQAINALTLGMIRALRDALDAWAEDPAVRVVVIDGAGERGLCAGADIKALRAAVLEGESWPADFFAEEYRVDALIARYPKPIVTIMDGIVMGGGIGLASHAAHRVATDRLRAAMPEVGIGFFCDVGATWLMSRTPGWLGEHLALTGDSIGAADALHCGLADVVIDHARIEELVDALGDHDPAAVLATFADPAVAADAPLAHQRAWIDRCYDAPSVADIIARLDADGGEDAARAAATIRTRSPTSLAVTLAAVRGAPMLGSLEACLDVEFRIACAMLDAPDYVEGIRAVVVDKDHAPRWNPAAIADVTAADVERYFAVPAAGDLGLSAR